MIRISKDKITEDYSFSILKSFKFLVDFFNFEPGDISVKVLKLNDFEQTYEKERGQKSAWFVVGFAADNGRIFILNKKDFEKKSHNEDEFEKVITHELCHIFIRRILEPKQTYVWIQEGICEYLSFGCNFNNIKNLIDFKQIETEDGWDKNNPYQQCAAFFSFLSKIYGKKKVTDFLKSIKKNSEEEAFKKIFGDFREVQENFFKWVENEKTSSSRNSMQ